MGVNLYESPQQPIVDLDTDIVVYVPGYAIKGPGEPTLVDSGSFTAIFGEEPYKFKYNQTANISKNSTFANRPDKSWLYAKGLTDAGLTVLYHRTNPQGVGVAVTGTDVFKIAASTNGSTLTPVANMTFSAQAKYFGSYYGDLVVKFSTPAALNGNTMLQILRGVTVLESYTVSFNPTRNNFIGNINFAYVDFFTGVPTDDPATSTQEFGFDALGLDAWYADPDNAGKTLYAQNTEEDGDALVWEAPTGSSFTEEFTVKSFEDLLESSNPPFDVCLDTDKYPTVTYLTTGGYYQATAVAGALQDLAWKIKSMSLNDLPETVTTEQFLTFQSTLLSIPSTMEAKAKGAVFIGADTFVIDSYRTVMPDSYGYLQKLASNLSQSIPAWIPVANNPQGVVSAIATTRPVDRALRLATETDTGPTFNPIIYKQNVGYTIMGNRTMYPNDGVLGPTAFLNCQLVVNSVCRSARRAASDLLIVSTNPNTAFNTFRLAVGRTCDRMLVNGDGLSSYSIRKLPKTKPATLDIDISLVVVEGIETFNINISYSLQLD